MIARRPAALGLALALAAALPAESDAQGHGICAELEHRGSVVARSYRIPAGAGLVVDRGTASLEAARLVGDDERPHALALEPLFGTLHVLRVPAGLAPGSYDLRDGPPGPRERPYEVTADTIPAPLAAPRLRALRRIETEHRDPTPPHDRWTELELRATLRADWAADALVLVARWTDDGGEHVEWTRGHDGRVVVLGHDTECDAGHVPARRTDVALVWIDVYGQMSEPATVRVR